jgi:Fe-S-cluster containining protein
MPRTVTHRYDDPLDRLWLHTAERLGLTVVRSDAAYASTDGRGRLLIGTRESLDADDCLAQIIFHELCHALVQGPASMSLPDWGLDNETDRDQHRELACLRVQAALAARHGLRALLAPTTDHRPFYDALPADPLEGPAEDPSVPLAKAALRRAGAPPWREPIEAALGATAQIAAAARFATTPADLLHLAPAVRAGRHRLGFRLGPSAETCGSCAWLHKRGRSGARCLVAKARTSASSPACEYWEAPPDCHGCGACCREAYDVVEIARREPVLRLHPELIVKVGGRDTLRREGTSCAALSHTEEGYTCLIYEDRPKTCRDFTRGGENCLAARRRVGLSATLEGLPDHENEHRRPEEVDDP